MRYDVQELRRAARQVNQAAQAIQGAGRDGVNRVKSGLAGSFRGDAADALDNELSSLQSDLLKLANGLAAIDKELRDYAQRLEQADRDAASFIKNK